MSVTSLTTPLQLSVFISEGKAYFTISNQFAVEKTSHALYFPHSIFCFFRKYVTIGSKNGRKLPVHADFKVKVMSNEVGLRLLCCGMCFPYIYLFVATRHDIKTDPIFQKASLNNEARNARLKIKTRHWCFYITVFLKADCL